MRKRLAMDVETYRTQQGLLVPRLVCMSVSDGKETRLFDRAGAIRVFRDAIADDGVELVGHHFPFDLAVLAAEAPETLPAIFRALRLGRLRCTMIRQQLMDIAEDKFRFWHDRDGKARKTTYGLDQLVFRHLGIVLQKDGTPRTRFHEVEGLAVEDYPAAWRTYAMKDAEVDWLVAQAQDEYVGHEEFPTEQLQMRSAWSLHLMSAHGIRANPERVKQCKKLWFEEREQLDLQLKAAGLVRKDGSKDTKVIAALVVKSWPANFGSLPLTPTGDVQLTKQVLADCNDPLLRTLMRRNKISKWIETYLPMMSIAAEGPFNAGYHTLVTSGRTSCGAGEDSETGNMQNLPRFGPVRECFEARPGKLFCATDLDTAELRSVAEVCIVLGISPVILAEEFKQGMDPHLSVAAEFLHADYAMVESRKNEKDVDDARNLAKIYNFGLWGGMGVDSFVEYARGYGMELDRAETAKGIETWKRHYREVRPYFRFITQKTAAGKATSRHPITGFVRAGTYFPDLANHYFQHLTACCAKEGLAEITEECYLGRSSDGAFDGVKKLSPLYGSRPVMFVHDETVTETPEWIAHEAAHRQAELMKRGADVYIKHVPNSSSMALMKNLHKKAKPVFDGGRLIPWVPKESMMDRAA